MKRLKDIVPFFIGLLTMFCFPCISGAQEIGSEELSINEKFSELSFPLVHQQKAASIYLDESDAKVVNIAAGAFQKDIQLLTGRIPSILHQNSSLDAYPVIIGTLGQSRYIDQLAKAGKIDTLKLAGKWETFSISVLNNPAKGVKMALVIAGSDRRGTAFGIFELSRMLGISPLCWWADVKPAHKNAVYIKPGKSIIGPPLVKYRGIFINDEDWGIQPWAAKNMDTLIKDLGPKAYTRIFELLLRLKANYIWPGMHPSTKAFYYYYENPKVADAYAIVLGSSHCEPMLRNNVFEWAENFEHEYGTKPGEWRYDLNKDQIATYWKDRVKQAKNYESIYTVGMRGIHDGSMPGPKDRNDKVKLLGQVIADQRNILSDNLNKPVQNVPQIFCPYKEVLSLYQAGLNLPDDVTIVWADDNFGYIRQLSDKQEQKRSGGSGVYYHLSYWGTPQDYLWLSSTSPALMSYELTKAYQYKADRVWIANVGDIKPAEMEIQFFMDMAWNPEKWKPDNASQYAEQWAKETFGVEFAKPIADIKSVYYRLAQSAKPEQVDMVNFTIAEADERLIAYEAIYRKAKALNEKIPARLKDAYFELILYPVEAAYLMNQKILYAKRSLLLAENGDQMALSFAQKSRDAFEQIKLITKKYNEEIAGGKWNGIMSWKPRNLAVFNMPKVADKISMAAVKPAPGETGKVTIVRASAYAEKFVPEGLSLQVIKGLGLGADGISLYPFSFEPVKENELDKAAFVVYNVNSNVKAEYSIELKCLPTQGVVSGSKIRYAISVNGEKPQIVNISPASENNTWKQNVVRGYASGTTNHHLSQSGKLTIKVYLLDPGLVLNQLEIK